MRKFIFSFVLGILLFGSASSQSYRNVSIGGQVLDSLECPMISATVVLLQAADSVISSFSITDAQGQFEMKRVNPGDYVLQISYVGYQSYSDSLLVDGEIEKIDIGAINMKTLTSALDEVVVNADRIPMMIKKDTIVYNADAFKTQPNDRVEDLLRKLPGMEVEADGTIKAQGEEVRQVLVDGKEFFGRDPQIATKNLPAAAVQNVEVFDKKSEMAEFTGIDDGQEEKAINLELKEEHKKGVFGSLSAGYGTEDRFRGNANINKFTKTQQISLIGVANNVNEQGFSLNDYVQFAGGLSSLMRGGGGRATLSGVPISDGVSDGFVNTGALGLHYNQELGKKVELNANYFYSRIKNDILQEVRRENILGDESFLQTEDDDQETLNANHRVNLNLDFNIDTSQNLEFRSTLAFNDSELASLSRSNVFNPAGSLENEGNSDNRSFGENLDLSTELIYRKKFAKRGRSFSGTLTFGMQDNNQDVNLRSLNTFFDQAGGSSIDSIFQDQYQTNDQTNYGVEVAYIEPLGGNKFLGLDYSRRNFSNEVLKDVFDLENSGRIFNNRLSNHYNRDYVYDKGDVSLRWIKGKSNLNVIASLQQSNLTGDLVLDEASIEKTYTNFLPRLTWSFDISRSKNLRLSYNTSVREPSITQLQPIVDNSNPLNIYVGNPDLEQEYSHRLNLRFFSFSQFSMTNFFASITGTYTDNAIVNSKTIDDRFIQITKPVNIDNDYRLNSFLGFGTPLRFVKTRVNVHANFGFNRGSVFVNDFEEITNRYNSSIELSFDNQQKDLLDLRLGGGVGHSLTEYSVSSSLDQDYFNQNYFIDAVVNIGQNWAVGSKLDYSIYSGGTFSNQRTVPIWEASLTRYLMHKRGQIDLMAFDILNKNIGFQQSVDLNYIEDVRIKSLGQYFMLKLTYSLNQMVSPTAAPAGRMHMIRRRR